MYNEINEECGVAAVFQHKDAPSMVALLLHSLQHRGHESMGIQSCDQNNKFYKHVGYGCVLENTQKPDVMPGLLGDCAIGHVRYSTSGDRSNEEFQPLSLELPEGTVSLAHNGNIVNVKELAVYLESKGRYLSTTVDTEVFMHLIFLSDKTSFVEKLRDAASQVVGAYSLAVMTKDAIFLVRDPLGIRPLSIGKKDGACIAASESCAFDIIGATFERDVLPGEIVMLDRHTGEVSSCGVIPSALSGDRFCIFEYVYFARNDSVLNGVSVYNARKNIGRVLAEESSVEADMVIPVMDSGLASAMGYAVASGIPLEVGIVRNQYVGRTFIEPTDAMRTAGVKLKHSVNSALVKGKRVVVVDDSLVRGTTSKQIISMLRAAGAKEVHFRVASPIVRNSCFYGIDTPRAEELIGNSRSVQEIAEMLAVDSLSFISIDGLYTAVCGQKRNSSCPQYCDACFSGDYPLAIDGV